VTAKKVSLLFPSILELVDFTIIAETPVYLINRQQLSLTGTFIQADIELARRGFHASVVEFEE
jgi:hypothetical protein